MEVINRIGGKMIKRISIKNAISFVLSIINICFIVSLEAWTKSASKVAIAVFVVSGVLISYLMIYNLLKQQEVRLVINGLLWGALMSIAYVSGCRMRRDNTVLSNWTGLAGLLLQIVCLTVLMASGVILFLKHFPPLQKKRNRNSAYVNEWSEWKVCLFYSLAILLCWLPIFFAYYPSVFTYDAPSQLLQILEHNHSTHHPLIHTLFMSLFFHLDWDNPYLKGMVLYSIVQMVMMAVTFGYTLMYLYRKKVTFYLRIMLFLFYAFFPANLILALSVTKDVLFSALVLLYTFSTYRLVEWRTIYVERLECIHTMYGINVTI